MVTDSRCGTAGEQCSCICMTCGKTGSETDISDIVSVRVTYGVCPKMLWLCPACYRKYHSGLMTREECEKAGIEYCEYKNKFYSFGKTRQRDYNWFKWGHRRHQYQTRMSMSR